MDPEVVTLIGGAEVPRPAVVTTLMAADELMQTNPIAFYELVQASRIPGHELFGNTGEVLTKWGLANGGTVISTVREIIAAAAIGEDFDLRLRNPIAR